MKTILRNLLSVLRRFKMATLLNVLGLSVAFSAFILIMMQVEYDQNFDRGYTDTESIFRVEAMFEDGGQAVICRPLADAFIQSSPHIVAGTLANPWGGDLFFSVEENGVRNTFKEQCINVYPEFTKVFDFKFQEGNPEALQEPNVVLLPQSMAQKFFGNQSAVGKQLKFENGDHLTVGGVYKDYPRNSSVRNCIYQKMDPKENAQSWGNWNYIFYIRLDNPKNVEGLFENFKAHFDPALIKDNSFSWGGSGMTFRINPLPDVHYTTDVKYDQTPKASRQTLMILFAIAIVIVIIAGINFTNFSTALTPMRIKSINTQKVLGGKESVIRFALILEAVLISIISYLLGLLLVYIAGKTEIASLINADISLSMHIGLVLATAFISIATGLLAGIYPAYYMTSFPPALVLKGSFGLSPKGRQLRNALIGVQYVASFGLIIGATFMYLQNYYMQNTPLGYDKDEIIITNMNNNIRKSRDAFASQVKSFSGIEEVTYAEMLLSSQDQYMGWGRKYRDKDIQFQCLPVEPSFLKVMNVKISEGRDFREEDKAKRYGTFVFNERARTEYGLEIGSLIDSMEIVGFMPDVKFASFRTEVTPMAFFVWGTNNWGNQPNYAYIKVKAGSDLRGAMQHVKTTLQSFDPEYPFNVRFFDEVLNGLYEKERSLSSLITLFSLIAIFISVVGVFGLVVFDSEYRKKEIGIRKVLGSTTEEIIVMFNKTYIRILCVCFVLGAPIAGYVVHRWLENFAYKTPMYWWVYLIAFAIIAVITILTVTFQNWRAANENPVHVSWNFFKVMGIPLIGGRMPTESDERGNNYSYVFNRQMRDKWNMEPNDIMRIPWLEEESADGSVIGFIDDVKFTSLRQSVSELGFVINEPRLMLYSFIRVKAGSDIMGVVDHIRKTVAHLDPTYPCEVEFYDEIFDHLYHQERNLSTMILLFSLLAVIISIVGIFGLVIFETQYRRKEIGIRKVFGATVHEILVMFNKIYFRIVCVCFIIAAPLAYYGVRKWLEGFAYKTPIYWWIFAFALLIVSLITMFTVTFQNWRAANANPVDSIKTE